MFNTPTYCTAQEVKDNTRITDLASQTDDFINKLIVEAEDIVDAYIDKVWDKLVETQYRKLPSEDYETIPLAIKIATVRTVWDLFAQWEPNGANSSVLSEKWSSTSFETKYWELGKWVPTISKVTKDILNQFKYRSYKIKY